MTPFPDIWSAHLPPDGIFWWTLVIAAPSPDIGGLRLDWHSGRGDVGLYIGRGV